MGQQETFSHFSFSNPGIDIKIVNGIAVVKCIDRIDIYNSPVFDAAIDMLIRQSNNSVLLNMRDVFYIDSSGLGVLISSMRKLNKDGRFFKIFGLGEFVKKVFKRSLMTTYFDIYETEEDALMSITNSESAD
ncbi:MAG TPA: STAS domain-containing protein [Spirochaetota bacterium]|nr:STAS domain-containing protein [Spirochaetota bacterium]HPF06110.1 STAS domain-containing protein [Spirochaetota bacterium]HPJ43115.1 STAS domain-containing protein [Spirochaetota bacterium]HPR37206.1 STAS domain-containing protein [Spirochaetota bacterium]HRX48280.1 STAS domain-containing protein [Spirochaetota bacterium]